MTDNLIARAQAGDREAFSQLILQYQSAIRGYLARRIADPDEVFDLAQEVFLGAYRNLAQFDTNRDFGAWLRGIARHVAINYLRKKTGQTVAFDEVEEGISLKQADELAKEADHAEAVEDRLPLLRDCVAQMKQHHERSHRVLGACRDT
jgi:RNA polymerase sigma-70 factor, ECF subfamily